MTGMKASAVIIRADMAGGRVLDDVDLCSIVDTTQKKEQCSAARCGRSQLAAELRFLGGSSGAAVQPDALNWSGKRVAWGSAEHGKLLV